MQRTKQPFTVPNIHRRFESVVCLVIVNERERERQHRTLTIDRISFSPKNNQTTRKLTTAHICISIVLSDVISRFLFFFFLLFNHYHSMMGNLFNEIEIKIFIYSISRMRSHEWRENKRSFRFGRKREN